VVLTGFTGGICILAQSAGARCDPLAKKSFGHEIIVFGTERRRKQVKKNILIILDPFQIKFIYSKKGLAP